MRQNAGLCENWLKHTLPLLTLIMKSFKNILVKGESTSYQNILHLPECISPFLLKIYFIVCKCFKFRLDVNKELKTSIFLSQSLTFYHTILTFTTLRK